MFETEYGTLKLSSVIVPDFSYDEHELKIFEEIFDTVRAFMKEKNIQDKGILNLDIAHHEIGAMDFFSVRLRSLALSLEFGVD